MKRRRFLAAVAASLSLAGCGSRGPTSADGPGTSTPAGTDPGDTDPENTTETTDPTGTDPPDARGVGETTSEVNPHGLTVRNDGEDTRTVELQITNADTDETLLDRSYTLGSEEEVSSELRGPATYDVRVAVPEAETEHVTTVDYFDTCNSYGTTVRIHPDGTITSETIRTLIACEEPTATPDESD